MLLTHYAIALTSAARVLGALVPSAQPPSAPASKRGLKVDFDVLRGESIQDASVHKRGGVAKRSDGSALLELKNLATFYQAVVYMGSRRDECKVLVSTDTSDLWVMESNFVCGYPDTSDGYDGNATVSGHSTHSTNFVDGEYAIYYEEYDYDDYTNSYDTYDDDYYTYGTDSYDTYDDDYYTYGTGSYDTYDDDYYTYGTGSYDTYDDDYYTYGTGSYDTYDDDYYTYGTGSYDTYDDDYYTYGTGSYDTYDDDYYTYGTGSYETDAYPTDSYDSYDFDYATDEYSDGTYTAWMYPQETELPVAWPDLEPQTSSPCTLSGTFDTAGSNTFKTNDTNFISFVYGMSTASGFYATDTVGFANVSMELSFLVAESGSIQQGLLGIGLPGNEAQYQGVQDLSQTYRNFPMQLKNTGIIDKIVYSLYLNSNSSESGSVLFGAVDHSKYSGQLQTVPMLKLGESLREHIIVTLSGIYMESNGTSMSSMSSMSDSTNTSSVSGMTDISNVTITNQPRLAVFDSGATLQFLPSDVLEALAAEMEGEYREEEGIYKIDCSHKHHVGNLVYDFSGVHIKVPVPDMVYEVEGECYLGASDYLDTLYGRPTVILGDSFLRHAYVVFDLEDFEVSMAQARYTDEEDVEAVVSSIPSAVKAPHYSSASWHGEYSDATETESFSATSGVIDNASSPAIATGSSANAMASADGPVSLADDGARAVVPGVLAMGMVGAVLLM